MKYSPHGNDNGDFIFSTFSVLHSWHKNGNIPAQNAMKWVSQCRGVGMSRCGNQYAVTPLLTHWSDDITLDCANASVTSHSWDPYGLFPGCLEQKSYVHSRDPCGAVRILSPRTGPVEFLCMHYKLMPQSHPTTGPVRILSPVRFLARKAEWSARTNFTSVLFSWSH